MFAFANGAVYSDCRTVHGFPNFETLWGKGPDNTSFPPFLPVHKLGFPPPSVASTCVVWQETSELGVKKQHSYIPTACTAVITSRRVPQNTARKTATPATKRHVKFYKLQQKLMWVSKCGLHTWLHCLQHTDSWQKNKSPWIKTPYLALIILTNQKT